MQEKSGVLQIFAGLGDDDWIDDTELARRWGKSRQTVKRRSNAPGGIPHTRVASDYLYRIGSLRAYLLSLETNTRGRGRRVA